MERKQMSSSLEAAREHEALLIKAMQVGKWMVAVWKVENGRRSYFPTIESLIGHIIEELPRIQNPKTLEELALFVKDMQEWLHGALKDFRDTLNPPQNHPEATRTYGAIV